jgi:hypothetical protein
VALGDGDSELVADVVTTAIGARVQAPADKVRPTTVAAARIRLSELIHKLHSHPSRPCRSLRKAPDRHTTNVRFCADK